MKPAQPFLRSPFDALILPAAVAAMQRFGFGASK
jgi:hypothetical protein